MTEKPIDENDGSTTEAPVANVDPKATMLPDYGKLMQGVMSEADEGSEEDPNAPKEKPIARVSKETCVPTEADFIAITQETVRLQAERQAAAQAAVDGTPTKKIKIISLKDLRNMNNKE